MPVDPLDLIAKSYLGIHESTMAIRESTRTLDAHLQYLSMTHRLALRLQGFALGLLGLALVGTGFLIWQGIRTSHDHAALLQALTVQTQALRQQLK